VSVVAARIKSSEMTRRGSAMPYYELIGEDPKLQSGHTSKYWEITQVGKKTIIRYGKIGTDGQLSNKEFETKEEAEAFVAKKIKEKTKEGYIEKPSPHA
jgi:predicted DNA-binding WGR domain protein